MLIAAVIVSPLMEVLLRIKLTPSLELALVRVEWLLVVHIEVRLRLHLERRLLPMWWLPWPILLHRAYRILPLKWCRLKWFRHCHWITWSKARRAWFEVLHISL